MLSIWLATPIASGLCPIVLFVLASRSPSSTEAVAYLPGILIGTDSC